MSVPAQQLSAADKLLEVEDLIQHFPVRGGVFSRIHSWVKAVDGVSFYVRTGETLGLVGESGCGKTTTGRTILHLPPPTSGRVLFEGEDLFKMSRRELRRVRRDMQIIFQDPYDSLNPRLTVGEIIAEPMIVHRVGNRRSRKQKVAELLKAVGLSVDHKDRYPHEFSGGQRQRIGIARALALNPKLIICDEPVSALDVSIQAQILNLLVDLQEEFGLTYLFIAHDLGVVKHMADRIAVMYLGKMVEMAAEDQIYVSPRHPYTQALLSAIPMPDPDAVQDRIVLEGDVPSPIRPPSGCRFHTRCPYAQEECRCKEPDWTEIRPEHFVACHRVTARTTGPGLS